jgi:Lanthionine synthetase C-like protein
LQSAVTTDFWEVMADSSLSAHTLQGTHLLCMKVNLAMYQMLQHMRRLVHWCHGATGLVPLLAAAQRVLGPRPEWRAAADRAVDVVRQRGLLLKVSL